MNLCPACEARNIPNEPACVQCGAALPISPMIARAGGLSYPLIFVGVLIIGAALAMVFTDLPKPGAKDAPKPICIEIGEDAHVDLLIQQGYKLVPGEEGKQCFNKPE
ncbi:MAG: hypothetical protein H0U74_06775 [Bradymonadaceae bacterium]|nr:hypothetical protein [Lujinxingiaceae bacterium]